MRSLDIRPLTLTGSVSWSPSGLREVPGARADDAATWLIVGFFGRFGFFGFFNFAGFVVLAEHLGGDLGAEALERKSARLCLGGRTRHVEPAAELLLRERPHLLIVPMGLHRIGDLATLGDDLVEGLLLHGRHRPVLGFGRLGDLTGLGPTGA